MSKDLTCISCNVILDKSNSFSDRKEYNICTDCRFDPTIMISLTEAKRKYKLTDNEIRKADLFHITFVVHRNIGTKYLTRDIQNLANQLTKDLDTTDKRKMLCMKLNDVINAEIEKDNLYEKRKQVIEELVKSLISKAYISVDESLLFDCFSDSVENQINKYAADEDIDVFKAAMRLYDNIYANICRQRRIARRIKKMDKYLEQVYDECYIDKIKNNAIYKNYVFINNDINVNTVIKNIKDLVNNIKQEEIIKQQKDDRYAELVKYINENVPKTYHNRVFDLVSCRNYIDGINDFEKVKNDIMLEYKRIKGINSRTRKLDKLLDCQIDKNYLREAKDYKVYTTYIKSGTDEKGNEIDVLEALNQIKEKIQKSKIKRNEEMEKYRIIQKEIEIKIKEDEKKRKEEEKKRAVKEKEKQERKSKLDKILTSRLNSDNIRFAHANYSYNEFIKNGRDENLENVAEAIIQEAELYKTQSQFDRDRNVKHLIGNNNELIKNITNSEIYKNYINGKAYLDDVKREIDRCKRL